jgi:hypothetical protein
MGHSDTCIGAGMHLERFLKGGTVVFPVNVRGLVRESELQVPHSELAMHVGAAGSKLVAFGCQNDRWCGVVWVRPNGECAFTDGLPSEVMHQGLLRQVKRITGLDVAALGAAKRPRKGNR